MRAAWAAFHKYRQELTSRSYRLCYRMRIFNMVITSTLTYASGTWTLSKEHDRLIRSAQRKLPRLIVQSKRRYKIKAGKEQNIDEEPKKDEDYAEDKEGQRNSENDTEEGSTSNTDCDQDRFSFSEDIDEEIDKLEIEEEEWIEYFKRSTREAEEQMKKANILCWIETQRKMKWRMAMTTASLLEER